MKTKLSFAFIVAISIMAIHAYAQNTFPSTGRVGINTTSPDASLQVKGGGRFGTTTPQAKLDVNGDAHINGLTVGTGGGNVPDNSAIGYQALSSDTGSHNIATGEVGIRNDYHYYMKKRNTNNTVGWVCLGAGVGMGIIGMGEIIGGGLSDGLTSISDAPVSNNNNMLSTGTVLFTFGSIVALASIPFFIAANHNKMKASLSLKNAGITINNQPLYKSRYTAVGINIEF